MDGHKYYSPAKGKVLLFEQTNIFKGARIVTDLRPIYPDDVNQPPESAILMHTLRIHYAEYNYEGEFYIGLNSSNLLEIQRMIQRALQKERGLKQMCREKGIAIVKTE